MYVPVSGKSIFSLVNCLGHFSYNVKLSLYLVSAVNIEYGPHQPCVTLMSSVVMAFVDRVTWST